MVFYIDEMPVYFPYSSIYPEQYEFMCHLKRTIDVSGHCLLEMPSGTGKTISLLSLVISYQLAHPEVGKLIYCTRTVPEIEKVMEEMAALIAFRDRKIGEKAARENPVLGLALSSRRNMCVHPEVSQETNRATVDAKCRRLTASWVRERAVKDASVEVCTFYEGYESRQEGGDFGLGNGVYSVEKLREHGTRVGVCPYFMTRRLLSTASVVVYSYQYMLDPKIANLVSKELKKASKEAIVVFDEAHNIDDVCISSMSVNLDRRVLDLAQRGLSRCRAKVRELKDTNVERLQREYAQLVAGLASHAGPGAAGDELQVAPVLAHDAVDEVVPGNIRKAEHFVRLMERFREHVKGTLETREVVTQQPLQYLADLLEKTNIEAKPLRFCTDRLGVLLRSLEFENIEEFAPLKLLCDFASLLGTYTRGFSLIIEPYDSRTPNIPDPILQFCCHDASLAMKAVFEGFRSVVITSGTLSPMDMYPKILGFTPAVTETLTMSLSRKCLCPLIMTRGSDQTPVSTSFETRGNLSVMRNYGDLLREMAAVVPDGLVAFFPSYKYMEDVLSEWNRTSILAQVLEHKLIFIETQDVVETTLALANFRAACEAGRGAILFSVARGKVSEGIDFKYHYGRAVIVFGVPFVYTESNVLKARQAFLREHYGIREADFITFDALRSTAQCVGRVIRSKNDYAVMVFADKRFAAPTKKDKLPKWIKEKIDAGYQSLSTDGIIGISRSFFREMAQPRDPNEDRGVSSWNLEHLQGYQREKAGTGGQARKRVKREETKQ